MDEDSMSGGEPSVKKYKCSKLEVPLKEDSKIEIIFNNKLIKEFKPTLDINTYYSDLDKSIFNRNNTLVFRNNFFISPKSLNGGSDIRPLSIRFYKFKIFCK